LAYEQHIDVAAVAVMMQGFNSESNQTIIDSTKLAYEAILSRILIKIVSIVPASCLATATTINPSQPGSVSISEKSFTMLCDLLLLGDSFSFPDLDVVRDILTTITAKQKIDQVDIIFSCRTAWQSFLLLNDPHAYSKLLQESQASSSGSMALEDLVFKHTCRATPLLSSNYDLCLNSSSYDRMALIAIFILSSSCSYEESSSRYELYFSSSYAMRSIALDCLVGFLAYVSDGYRNEADLTHVGRIADPSLAQYLLKTVKHRGVSFHSGKQISSDSSPCDGHDLDL
jgi:hypothetical protein